MLKTGQIIFIWIFSICLSSAQGKTHPGYSLDKTYTPAELNSDLNLLRKALQEAHPGLYRYNTPEQINAQFDSLAKTLDHPETEIQFYGAVSKIIAGIGCGHTATYLSKNYKKSYAETACRYFPFQVRILDHKIYALANFSTDSTIKPGTEILEINGKKSAQICSFIYQHICSDGYNMSLKPHDAEEEFMFYYSELIGQPELFQLKLKAPDDALIQNRTLPALRLDEMEKICSKRYGRKNLHPAKKKPLRFSITDEKVGVLTVSSFDANDISSAKQHFHAFIREAFDSLKKKGVNDLVLDLRDNGGGDDDFGWYLYSFLADSAFRFYDHVEVVSDKKLTFLKYTNQPRVINFMRHFVSKDSQGKALWTHGTGMRLHSPQSSPFRGNVFILINGESFSATAEFCAIADYHKRATFIGEETGGAYEGNNSGMELMLTLPNTHIRVNIPIMKYVCAVDNQHPKGRGIMPDYPIQPSIEDILQGKDTEMEFVLELIRRKNCKACGR